MEHVLGIKIDRRRLESCCFDDTSTYYEISHDDSIIEGEIDPYDPMNPENYYSSEEKKLGLLCPYCPECKAIGFAYLPGLCAASRIIPDIEWRGGPQPDIAFCRGCEETFEYSPPHNVEDGIFKNVIYLPKHEVERRFRELNLRVSPKFKFRKPIVSKFDPTKFFVCQLKEEEPQYLQFAAWNP
jgi:hypothetical protein